jgi:hypothetical protein
MMIGLTAVNQPVHFIDIDRKIRGAGWAVDVLKSGQVTVQELSEAFDDTNLVARVNALGAKLAKAGPSVAPKGWSTFAEMIYNLPRNEDAKKAGTWAVDSLTILNEHLKTHLMHQAGRSKFTFDQWAALKVGWMDTISVIRDLAIENGKDLMFTVHERIKEEPGDRTTGIRMELVKQGEDSALQKTFQGTQDVKVWASIDGAFGDLIGAQMDEYYWLYVEVDGNKKPTWRCRVHPDGRRSLRTSFKVTESVYEPDFRKIWK